jgi:hypothetical protein
VPVSAPTLKQQVGSKNRGIGLKKLAAIPRAMVRATITKIQASGKDATVSAVIKAVDGDGKAERRAGRERELAEATKAASEVLGSKVYPVIMHRSAVALRTLQPRDRNGPRGRQPLSDHDED